MHTDLTLEDFDEATWDNVVPGGAMPFQSYAWVRSAAEAYAQFPARVVCIGSPGSPVAAIALGEVGHFGRLRQVGGIDLGESVPILARNEEALDVLLGALSDLRLPVCLGHYPIGDTDFVDRLKQSGKRRTSIMARRRPERGLPFLDFDEGWQDPEVAIGRNRRQSLRRKRKKAGELGEVRVEIHAPGPSEFEPLLNEAIALEAKGWKGRSRTAMAHDPRQEIFFRIYGRRAAERGILRICFLRIGENLVAMQIAVVARQRFWSIKIAYDEDFSSYSPGDMLMLEVVKYAVEHGLSGLEFCGKEAAWTTRWTERAHNLAAIRIYPATFSGAAVLVGDLMRVGKTAALRRVSAISSRAQSE